MKESLSEQISKLCGIEPIKRNCNPCQKCITCEWHRGEKGNKINKHKTIEECQKEHFIYPDFENNNNNFIKLLNTNTDIIIKNNQKIPCKPIWWIINERAYMCKQLAPYDAIDFLLHLILILKGRFGNIFTEEGLIKIKTAIKNQSWDI